MALKSCAVQSIKDILRMAQKRICMVAHRETWVHNHCDESLSPFNRISRRHRFHEFPCFCVISASQRATLQHYCSRGGHLPVAPDNRRARRGMRPRTLTRVDSGNKERRVRDTRCAYRVGGDGEKCAALKKKKKAWHYKGSSFFTCILYVMERRNIKTQPQAQIYHKNVVLADKQ